MAAEVRAARFRPIDGSVLFFPPWPLEPNVKGRDGREGGWCGERGESVRGGEITVEMPSCSFRAAMTRSKGLCFYAKAFLAASKPSAHGLLNANSHLTSHYPRVTSWEPVMQLFKNAVANVLYAR